MKLSKEEKINLVVGKDAWQTHTFNGKLEPLFVTDGPLGIRTHKDGKTLPSLAYPCSTVLANTWNLDLAFQMGKSIADDAIEKERDIILGPGVCLKRNPMCGRNFEYFSEDPLLSGLFGQKYIEGVQDEHVGTCLKHYCANNYETSRLYASSNIDEKTLNELYLKSFEIALKAKPWTVMCSYNLLNGVQVSENKELFDKLSSDFDFHGVIISDWDAVHKDRTDYSLKAGLDLIMPYQEHHISRINECLANGTLDMKDVERASNKIVDLIELNANERRLRKVSYTRSDRERIAKDIADEGIVLLKNNGVLPLKKDSSSIIVGDRCSQYVMGGGSGHVEPDVKVKTLEQCLKDRNFNFLYYKLTAKRWGPVVSISNMKDYLEQCPKYDSVIICIGNNSETEGEGFDRQNIDLVREEKQVIENTLKVHKNVVLIIYSGSIIDVSEYADRLSAILYVGFPGQYGNESVADVLLGNVNPSGKLTETFANSIDDYPSTKNFVGDFVNVNYEEGMNVGYRYFASHPEKILFPFGFGLSYSKFEVNNPKFIYKTGINDPIKAEFDLKNIGEYDGKEVIQVYYEILDDENRPIRELIAFKKITLKALEEIKESISIPCNSIKYYDIEKHYFVTSKHFKLYLCLDSLTVLKEEEFKF